MRVFLLNGLIKANKKIDEKEQKFETKERIIKNYRKINRDELEKYNEVLLGTKKDIEDKVKSILIVITIVCTLSFNLVNFINTNFDDSRIVFYIAFILATLVFLYMILAGVLALDSISKINKVAINKPKASKEQISNNIDFNVLQNIKRNNYMYTSYRCIRRALIIFMVFIIFSFIFIVANRKF